MKELVYTLREGDENIVHIPKRLILLVNVYIFKFLWLCVFFKFIIVRDA
jgi:hypothetical protein